jgi:hypothetical protein
MILVTTQNLESVKVETSIVITFPLEASMTAQARHIIIIIIMILF